MLTAQKILVFINITEIALPFSDMEKTANNSGIPDPTSPAPPVMAVPCNMTTSDFNFYLNGVSTAIIIALGVAGNLMSMIVLTRRAMRTSTNCFLTALAIWDSMVLVVCLLLVSLGELSMPFKEQVFPYIVVYIYPLGLSAQTATVWLTVSFTVERYIAVCHPLRAARMCTIPRARLVVFVISVVCVLYNVPRWFEYTTVKHTDMNNRTCILLGYTTLASDSIYHRIYFGWLYFLVMCFIPLCSLAILNAFLIVAVRRSQQQRKDMNVRQSRENNVTIMLVFVVMVFIICQVPALIYNMAYAINMPRVKTSEGWAVLSNFRNFLVTLNSAINFILYCALGQKFRRTFVRTFCPCLFRKMPGRFQSFSFHHNMENSANQKTYVNGNSYHKVLYKQCRTEPCADGYNGLSMRILKTKYPKRDPKDFMASVDAETQECQLSHHPSHKRLINGNGKPD